MPKTITGDRPELRPVNSRRRRHRHRIKNAHGCGRSDPH